jgi:hypothetical protein
LREVWCVSKKLYYRDRRLQSLQKGGGGMTANYLDIDTGEEVWVSVVKQIRAGLALGRSWAHRDR